MKERTVTNEYKKLLEYVYEYAKKPANDADEHIETGIGNVMRRVVEAFSSFCYNMPFEEMMCRDVILKAIPEKKRKYYENFICDDNIIPSARDFSIQFTVEDVDDGELLSAQNLRVSVNDKLGVISFGERKSRGDIELQKGDLITVVCEPNGLAKLYINGELSSSAYNEMLCSELKGSEIQLSEKVTNLTVISKALSFKEI